MPNRTSEITISFDEDTIDILLQLAQRREKAVASPIREIILEALEMHEDSYLAQIAQKRDREGAKTYNHKNVWKHNARFSTKKL